LSDNGLNDQYTGISKKSVKNINIYNINNFKNSDDEFDVDENGVVGGGTHLKPEQVHELVEKYGDDVVFFDGQRGDVSFRYV
jgi:hypothetical protein